MNFLAAINLDKTDGITQNDEAYLSLCIGVIKPFDEAVSDGVSGSLEGVETRKVEPGLGNCVLDVVHDVPLDALDVSADVVSHEVPELFISFSLTW